MNATPPEAKSEYSRGPRRSSSRFGRLSAGPAGSRRGSALRGSEALGSRLRAGLLLGGLLGAALLLVAEFTTLFQVTTSADSSPIKSVSTGSHHAYALIPIAVLTVALAGAVFIAASRPALLAIGALGVIALLISLLRDLPDVNASGLINRGAHYIVATSSPGPGMYLETLGAVVLLITCASGFVLPGAPGSGGAPGTRRAGTAPPDRA